MIDWKIPIVDLINLLFIMTAGILGYFLIDRIQEQDSKVVLLQGLATNVSRISPGLDMHMANRILDDGQRVFKVYLKNVSQQDVTLGKPQFRFLMQGGGSQDHTPKDLTGVESMLAPGVDICVSFVVPAPPAAAVTAQFSLQARVSDAYADTLLLAVSELPEPDVRERITDSVQRHISRDYSAQLPVAAAGHNTSDWEDFCMLSR